MARRYHISVVVRNYRHPEDPGTAIDAQTPDNLRRQVTGIADMPSLAIFTVEDCNERVARRIGELLALARLNYQVVPVNDGSWKFGVKREKYRSVSEIINHSLQSRGMQPHFGEGQWALVTLVGEGLRGQIADLASRVKTILLSNQINVEGEIRDALSYSVLVKEVQRNAAIIALHEEFIEAIA
jgi:aspartokinase